jgi:tetratricopeptide (TPR) repeat protein
VIESISLISQLIVKGYSHTAMEEAYYAMEYAPSYLPLHSIMGEILEKDGDIHTAVEKYGTVARLYSIRGDMQESISFYHKVVDLAPTDLNARMRLIDQLKTFGKVEEAIEETMQLAEVYNSMGDLEMARKTYAECLRIAQQANVVQSLQVIILKRMADIDLQNLDWRQALRVLDQISTMQPDDEEIRFNLIQLNIRLEQEPQALTELDKYLEYLNNMDLESRGPTFMEGLINEFPENIPLRRRLADLYRKLGNITEAVDQLDAIGKILLDAGDRAGAIQTIEKILSIDPPNKADYQEVLDQLRQE